MTNEITPPELQDKPVIYLKWGTIKGWKNLDKESKYFEKIKEYFADGVIASAMADRPNNEKKHIICAALDLFEGTVINDWSGEIMTIEQAKKYINEY